MNDKLEIIHFGDCVQGMNALPEKSVNLVFADPPFNIGYEYDVYKDRMDADDYLQWSSKWLRAVWRVLQDDGTFWLAIGDEFAAELKIAATDTGFQLRSWVVWYYTFGVNCVNKFTRSHTHLFYFVKDSEHFTFRGGDPINRVPSARQLVYNDRRASSKGRLPDDTWIIPPDIAQTFALRPQDLATQFGADEDTWYFPRVAGTFKERAGFHGCQMPEQLLGRIIRCCSEENDLVMDPFAGSASTLIVARKLGRRVMGFELSEEYAKAGMQRLETAIPGDALTGAPEPTMSARPTPGKETSARTNRSAIPAEPSEILRNQIDVPTPSLTADKKNISELAGSDRTTSATETTAENTVPEEPSEAAVPSSVPQTISGGLTGRLHAILNETIATAFENVHEGWAVDRILTDPRLQTRYHRECMDLGLPLTQKEACLRLLKLRKKGIAPKGSRRYSVSGSACEPYLHASEIAWATVHAGFPAMSLEEILSDPERAAEFDAAAEQFAPGFTSLEYRWGALRLRKSFKKARQRGLALKPPRRLHLGDRFSRFDRHQVTDASGIYLLYRNEECLYVGAANSLQQRLQSLTATPSERWGAPRRQLKFRYFTTPENDSDLLAWVSAVISLQQTVPGFNLHELYAERTGGHRSAVLAALRQRTLAGG